MKNSGLPYQKLRNECDPETIPFSDTSVLEPLKAIIGQERAESSMEFGLKIRMRGYNIFMCGTTGTGKTTYAQTRIKKTAEKCRTPDDWCYVYNFDDSNQPLAVNLPAGQGREFMKDMAEFVKVLKLEIPKVFESEDYEREKTGIMKEFQEKRSVLLEKLNEDASKHGFKVKITNSGIFFLPVVEGKVLNEQEFSELDEGLKHEISEKSTAIQSELLDTIRKIRNIDKDAEKKVEDWENRIALFAVGMHINDLKEKYREHPRIAGYLEKLQEDILKHLDDFRKDESAEEKPPFSIPWMRSAQSPADRYKVNLFVDNSNLKGAPVIADFNPTYYNLVGKIEYENEFGAMMTDFSLIKPGLLHLANGGYLILKARDVLINFQAWEVLKRVLTTRQINIGNLREEIGIVAVSTLKPEPVPLDIKVVLVGNPELYLLLYELDEDFRKLFKIKVDFDDEMERNKQNIIKIGQFISMFSRNENILHFDRTAVAAIVDYSSWLVGDKFKLSTRFDHITELLSEASTWASLEECSIVGAKQVKKALEEKNLRSNKYDMKILELLKNGTILIDTDDEKIGQINGLSVLDTGDYSFGKPARITASTYMGEKGIVNIEREVHMSGAFHSKGVLILSGYIGEKYAQEIPLALTASLCFEQIYGGIDGDSASSAELYAILSSLAEAPIKQGIAVTGSINQKGEIQPIGGVTIKIEGFFELCKLRGLTGKQGVIIPHQNVRNLMLAGDVVEAVKSGKFHIYAIKTIDEGVEILTGIKAGKKRKDGRYPYGTINSRVFEKMRYFAKTVAGFGREQ